MVGESRAPETCVVCLAWERPEFGVQGSDICETDGILVAVVDKCDLRLALDG